MQFFCPEQYMCDPSQQKPKEYQTCKGPERKPVLSKRLAQTTLNSIPCNLTDCGSVGAPDVNPQCMATATDLE